MTTSRLLVLVAAVTCAAQTPTLPQQIGDHLTANDLKADVSFLASDALEGRGTPSRGLDIAAEYIAAQFRRAGLEPVGNDGYFQTAAYSQVRPNPDGPELTFQIGDKTSSVPKTAMSLSEPGALNLNHAPALKISSEDRAALDALTTEQVADKVLMVELPDANPARTGAFAAIRRITLLAGKLHPALVLILRSNPVPLRSGGFLREGSAAPGVPTIVVWDAAAREAVAHSGDAAITASVNIPAPAITPVTLRNVAGVLRGSDPALKDTYVVVTAHYDHLGIRGTGEGDHIYNGANDDASGTASVIEIANTLAALPTRPKRSIVFIALFGEEMGLLGSRYYVAHPIFPLAKTIADINLEQMGRTDDNTGPRVGVVNATGFDFTTLTGDLKASGPDFGIQVLKDEQSSDPFYARSDNQAFADAGVPSHTLSVGYVFPDYHQPGDEWAKIDYDNMAKVDRTVALALFRIADSTAEPQWNRDNPKTERYVKAHDANRLTHP
jgi:hypothetical protein